MLNHHERLGHPAELYLRRTHCGAMRRWYGVLQSLLVMGAVACTDPMSAFAPVNHGREVATLSITPAEVPSVAVGRLIPLQATARDGAGALLSNVPITWASSDPEVVRIERPGGYSGIIQIVSERAGVATLTATSGRGSASVTIVVRAPGPVATLSIFGDSAVALGKTTQLSFAQRDSDGVVLRSPAPTFSSSDSNIARVSPAGLLIALAQGTATVTATSDGKRAARQLVVVAPEHAFMWTPATGMLDLETLPGFVSSKALAVSPAGHVAGTMSTIADSLSHAFVRSPGESGMRDLGGFPGGGSSEAFGVNSTGQVIGYATTREGVRHAVLWDSNGEMRDLGTLHGGHSIALGINDAGQVVGWTTNGTARRPFMWTGSTGMRAIAGISYGTAYAISQSGVIVGEGDNRPVLWNGNAAATALFLLNHDRSGRAVAISGAGHTVGTSRGCFDDDYLDEDCGEFVEHPVLWSSTSVAVDLRKTSGATTAIASVLGINSALQIVGRSALHRAVLLSSDGVRDLGVLPGRQWSVATAINDAGLVVGSSLNP